MKPSSEALLAEVDKLAIAPCTRSAIIEEAVQAYLANKARRQRDERELNLLNAHTDEFNAEMEEPTEPLSTLARRLRVGLYC